MKFSLIFFFLRFDFFLFYPFRIKNSNEMSILSQNYVLFWECSFGVNGKIGIVKDFLYGMSKVREKQSLIHLNESFEY